ncbi:MAG: hypothetical protein ABIU54_12880 [Candidatus Eisenbacteria bacterium]
MSDTNPTNHLSEARCADLVLLTLAPNARDEALAHARACPACEERLRLHAAVHARALAQGVRRFGSGDRSSRVLALPPRPWLWLTAAAALVAALMLPRLMSTPIREPQRWLPTPDAGIALREGETDPHFSAGLAAYARRDLLLARRELEAAKLSGGAETARQLYLGNILLALDEPESALRLLQRIDLLNVPEPWQEEALWSLQLAYRRTGQEKRADSLLRTLHSRPDTTR